MVYYYCHRTHHTHQINLIMILQKLWGIGTCNRIRGIGIGADLPSLTQPNNDIDIKTCLIISKNNSGINLHVRIHIKRYKTSKHKGDNRWEIKMTDLLTCSLYPTETTYNLYWNSI